MISNLDPANFLQEYNDVKAQDPNHIVYSSGWRLGNIGDYVDRVDALGMQPYHIPQLRTWMSCPGPSMAFSFHMIHETIKEAQIRGINNLPVIGNTQVFEWWQYPTDRYPNTSEVYNMVYQQIIAGAKGIIGFTFNQCCSGGVGGTGNLAISQPNLWNELKQIRSEVKTLENVILNGRRTTTIENPSEYSLFSSYWEYENKIYVAIANASDSTKMATVELPANTTGILKQMFEGRSSGMVLSNATIIGNIAPYDVHVYVVEPFENNLTFNGDYSVIAKHSGKAMEVANGSTENGGNVQQMTYTGATNQVWNITAVGSYYKLTAKHSGKVLDVEGGVSAIDNQVNIHQWENFGADNQLFSILPVADGFYKIIAKHSGKVVDVSGVSTADGANIHQWTYGGWDNQLWKFNSATGSNSKLYVNNTEKIADNSINLYPIPVTQNELNIDFFSESDQVLEMDFNSMDGQQVKSATKSVTKGINSFTIPVSEFKNGIYILKIQSVNKTSLRKVIIGK